MQWVLAIMGGAAISANIPAILHSLEWIILVIALAGIVIADRVYLGRSSDNNYTFSYTDPQVWTSIACTCLIAGLVGTYVLGALV